MFKLIGNKDQTSRLTNSTQGKFIRLLVYIENSKLQFRTKLPG